MTFVMVGGGDDGRWWWVGARVAVVGLVQRTDLTEVCSSSTFEGLYTICGSPVVFRL